MAANDTPEIIISEAVLTQLRGLRLSEDPRVAEVAAKREQEELKTLERLRGGKGSRGGRFSLAA